VGLGASNRQEASIFRYGHAPEKHLLELFRQHTNDLSIRGSGVQLIRLPFAAYEGWHDMCSNVAGLRIARTSGSHFGLFPPRIRIGDIIAMFNTCTILAVIRKTGDDYTFVGWCYISKYDGRAIDSLADDGLGSLERLELR
jgi:hypothetical protein